jgi:predicted nucleic acid-binding protein
VTDRIVIDSSVAIKWVVPEEGTDIALALRLKYEFCAPELIIPEIANILGRRSSAAN